MSNPFRARKLGNPADQPKNAPIPLQSTPTIANGYPGKSSISLELEVDDSSSEENPFNPDASASDSETSDSASKSSARGDRRAFLGSAPLPAPSDDGSSAPSSTQPPISADRNVRSVSGADGDAPVAPDASRDRSRHSLRSETQSSPSAESAARTREKKPPPPPKSHHGKRISHTAAANATASSDVDADAHSSQSTARSRSSNRLSIHDSSTERVTPGAAHPSSVSLPSAADYFSVSEDQVATESTDSLQRSHSQKRPPTPPLSRRHSQMRRSKSTQSKSSRLTMSSYDSEHESPTGSLPPSPGPPRSMASKRISMPPPSSSAEFQAAIPTGDVSVNPLGSPSSRPPSLKASRRASSYGSVPSNSSGPPPPPPPRRMRDSVIRSSDTPPTSRVVNDENTPLPQPSNALDILADLTKLQKEVDDLRGHYENRKVE